MLNFHFVEDTAVIFKQTQPLKQMVKLNPRADIIIIPFFITLIALHSSTAMVVMMMMMMPLVKVLMCIYLVQMLMMIMILGIYFGFQNGLFFLGSH
jgi:hypothetical protein